MEYEASTIEIPALVQKGSQLFVWYDGQITRMRCLQEFQTIARENNGIPKRGTNYHSLARDVEQERADRMDEPNIREKALIELESRGRIWKNVKSERFESKPSAFRKVMRTSQRHYTIGTWMDFRSSPSAVPVDFQYRMNSVFKPIKHRKGLEVESISEASADTAALTLDPRHCDLLMPYDFLALPKTLACLPGPEIWAQSESPPQVLPPTFRALGSTTQIWCAKCRLSFHMTSDLVLHMRLRHKKETGGPILSKRTKELQLSCPVCCACFRERHHLSRHMISHC